MVSWRRNSLRESETQGGKRTFEEEFGNDGISDAELVNIGELCDTDEVSDQQMIELGEEMERESSPLFHFDFEPVGRPKKALDTVKKLRGTAQKRHLREATKKDNIGQEITRGVADMVRRVVETAKAPNGRDLQPNDRVMFNFSTKKFSHPLQTAKFTVEEIAEDTTRWETYLQTLANQLNSNESFDATDDFQVDRTIIAEPDAGGKTSLSILGKINMTTVLRRKQCVLPIKNEDDNLCLARAICLMKAWYHKDEDRDSKRYYRNLQLNPSVLTRCAKHLHTQAGVPEGPCGRAELIKFQEYLAPDYRLKVVSVRYPYCITYEGQNSGPMVLSLLFESDPEGGIGHYHGCTSDAAFIERSYFCHECNRGFDSDEYSHHPCEGRRCPSCKTLECGPKDSPPSLHCTQCNRHFFDNSLPVGTAKKSDPVLRNFTQSLQITTPLQPREAFFGGRTGATTLYHRIDSTQREQIRYVDVTSEYPWVNKYGEYPIGHPTIILEPANQDPNAYYGLMKVSILPPTHLFNPVLPHRQKIGSASKLTFPLCRSCVTEESLKPLPERNYICPHTDEERMLTGTWCTPEIHKAIQMGYKLIRIHEVWHFEKRQRGLFAPYVDTWLKIKQESSGYPAWCQTEEQKAHYVSQYQDKEGIALDPTMIVKNPGRKATAKLMLNSFWGKFGQNCNKAKVHQFSHPAGLLELIDDPLQEVVDVRILSPELVEIVAKRHVEDPEKGKAVYVLQDRVLYYDTDSLVYKWRPGESEIPLGDYLGDLTNEPEDGDYIVEFISAGAKNYGYVTLNGKCCVKVKGFSLNVRGMQQLNYDIMKENILDEIQHPLEESRKTEIINPVHFVRDPVKKKIRTETQVKSYRLVFDKRVMEVGQVRSFPYGYDRFDEDDNDLIDLLAF
ncbi:hypothetical protein AWC38_SpisGene21885 [Stylophora pistillata]|uniref:DNA-directed DNA polymerase n=1 Tax=Stylophora pistillata TaxID=50429 RepID=A0A2B4RCA6_STYPI|nr:hypothetical protein AWC38_SpisGene21885 [Stylophora pistillata]